MKVIVTGGAGFIGSAVIRQFIAETDTEVVNVDKLTYAGNLESLADVVESPRYRFERVDICDASEIERVFSEHQPDAVMHLAAESHVDRSIDGPRAFIETNIVGTYTLLEAARRYWLSLDDTCRKAFRFHHISTDEVYGSLGPTGWFEETTPYRPNSPYSATKAAADHLVRAWHKTYGLPVVITNSSNNFGPFQFPEKLIPLVILKAIKGESLPIYGKGNNVRDWLYVDDHAEALRLVLSKGQVGETYNIGARTERTNLEVVSTICEILDEVLPASPYRPHATLITHVADRPGHDLRYAINPDKIMSDLGWRPRESFETGLMKTVMWYLSHQDWCKRAMGHAYGGERLGLIP